jgi:hypothetical protein
LEQLIGRLAKENITMMDIKLSLKKFCTNEWRGYAYDIVGDDLVINALSDRRFAGNRAFEVQRWLRSYQVFQGLNTNQRGVIAENLVSFYDANSHGQITSRKHLLKEFSALESHLRERADLVTRTGSPRQIESLTSKALWCCYPLDVPIMDSFAENALRMIARSNGMSIHLSDKRFDMFTELWFKVYETVKPQIVDFSIKESAYPLRVFDRYLWWLGQTSYSGLTQG